MKTRILLFVASLAIFIVAISRFFYTKGVNDSLKLNKTDAITAKEITKVRFPETIKNMGSGKLNVPVTANFVLYNTGSLDLYIQKVEPDCHCTKADFTHNKIPPNDSAIIQLVYDASNEGPYQSTAIATTNSDHPATLLVFRGTIAPF